MLENVNHTLFLLINATPATPYWLLRLALWVARYLIMIVPLSIITLWMWGPRRHIQHHRILVMKVVLAIGLSLCLSWLLGALFPHPRPFTEGIGYNVLHHAPDDSWPSNHGVTIFTFALAFLFWHRLWSGLITLVIGCAIAWARVFLGVHWPLDMLGALLVGMVSTLSIQIIWDYTGSALEVLALRVWRFCFALLIRKGWVHD